MVLRRAASRERTPPPKFIVLSIGAKMKMTLVHTARGRFTTFPRTVVPKVTCVFQNSPRPELVFAGVNANDYDNRNYAVFRSASDSVASANSRIISRLKAGRSSGLGLVTRPFSFTTSWLTQVAPALFRSVSSEKATMSLCGREPRRLQSESRGRDKSPPPACLPP